MRTRLRACRSDFSKSHAGRRLTHATAKRAGVDFARALQRIARRYLRARRIHLVLDNLSTHSLKCLVDALGPLEGRRLWRRFEMHYTPKHGSWLNGWLNAAELEASLVSRECLGRRRIDSLLQLTGEVFAWNRSADRDRRSIDPSRMSFWRASSRGCENRPLYSSNLCGDATFLADLL